MRGSAAVQHLGDLCRGHPPGMTTDISRWIRSARTYIREEVSADKKVLAGQLSKAH